MKNNFNFKNAVTILVVTISLTQSACRKEEEMEMSQNGSTTSSDADKYPPLLYDATVAQSWYTLLNKLIIQTPGHTPPIVAREIGYIGISLYESTVARGGGHQSLAGQLTGLSPLPARPYNAVIPPISGNAALARIIKDLYGNASVANIASIDSLELAIDGQFSAGHTATNLVKARQFGRDVADAIFTWSSTDGGHQAYLNNFPNTYVPPTGIGKWVPTPPAYSAPMLPYWGSNRAFIPADNSPLINPPVPIAFDSIPGSGMYDAANEVYTTVNNLTQAQKDIANYWANGGGSFTPPGHLLAIALQMIRNKNLNLRDAAILLAKVGIGLNDAGIVCWRAKYDNSLMRPITYIRKYIDPAWNSYIGTPPFPTYTSGHSTFSAAACQVLTKKFGPNVSFTDSTKVAYGYAPRSFTSFNQAGLESAVSRLYGGIHYTFDNDKGYDCGIAIELNIRTLRF